MKTLRLVVATALLAGAPLYADVVRLRSGMSLEGVVLSADRNQVRLRDAQGSIMSFQTDSVEAVFFSAPSPPSPPTTSKADSAATTFRRATLPAGMTISVLLIDTVDVDKTAAGETFRASLDAPLVLDGEVIVPRGGSATLQVAQAEQSGTIAGSDKVTLTLKAITVKNRDYQVSSNYVEEKGAGEGKKSRRKILGGAGLGAIVGGIAGGGTGAAIGAVSGAVLGTAISASGEEHLKVPAETRLLFELSADVNVDY